jgi:hypothetical protein
MLNKDFIITDLQLSVVTEVRNKLDVILSLFLLSLVINLQSYFVHLLLLRILEMLLNTNAPGHKLLKV